MSESKPVDSEPKSAPSNKPLWDHPGLHELKTQLAANLK